MKKVVFRLILIAVLLGGAYGIYRMFHGLPGRVRFSLPAEPLWDQWARRFRQMLQKRYRI